MCCWDEQYFLANFMQKSTVQTNYYTIECIFAPMSYKKYFFFTLEKTKVMDIAAFPPSFLLLSFSTQLRSRGCQLQVHIRNQHMSGPPPPPSHFMFLPQRFSKQRVLIMLMWPGPAPAPPLLPPNELLVRDF